MFQNARHSLDHARAALKYILLALSGYFDDVLGNYKVWGLAVILP